MANIQFPFGAWIEPDEQTLLKLYSKTQEFLKKKPWERINDDDTFVVVDPVSGMNGYCCLYGKENLYTGLQVFLGDEAFRSFMDIMDNIRYKDEEMEEDIFEQPSLMPKNFGMDLHCLSLGFTTKDDLTETELDFMKKNKLTFRSKEWPLFRIMNPGFIPWEFNEEHADFMICCLEQVMAVFDVASQDPELVFNDFYEEGCVVLTRFPLPGSSPTVWQTKYRKAKAITQDFDLIYRFKPALLKSLLEKPFQQGRRIDFASLILPVIVQDTIPFRFAQCLICMDPKKNKPLFSEIVPYQPEYNQFALNKLLDFLKGLDKKPEAIRIAGITFSDSLIDAMSEAEVHVDWVDQLPKCQKFADKLLEKFYAQGAASSPEISTDQRNKPKLKLVKND